jgi:HAD superfamily hydrolase (TIGR01662 family)
MPDPKLYIFDCDGTLRIPGSEADLMPRVKSRLERIQWGEDTCAAIASNQEGVALGRITGARAYQNLMETFKRALGAAYDQQWPIAMCPHTQKDRCICRKPSPYMLVLDMYRAINLGFSIGSKDVLFVGDEDRDQQAAERAGIGFSWAEDFFK